MASFEERLLTQLNKSDSGTLLNKYLSKRSGRHFEKFQESENKPNKITPSDLLAVSQLSMKIGGYQANDSISEFAVIKLFEVKIQTKISNLLKEISPGWRLESISGENLEKFNQVVAKLWPLLRNDVGLKKVATYKLMARKRPHLCPIRDSFAEQALGRQKDWYASWQAAFRADDKVVAKLKEFKKNNKAAKHLSLLRIADIIIWERLENEK